MSSSNSTPHSPLSWHGTHGRLGPDALLRGFVGIRRRFEDVVVEDRWAPWEKLPARKLRRPCTPSRYGMTIFARTKPSDSAKSSESAPLKRHSERLEETPLVKVRKIAASEDRPADRTQQAVEAPGQSLNSPKMTLTWLRISMALRR